MHRASLLLAVLLSAVPLFAQEVPFSMTPSSGPTTGGTVVTIKGNFGEWPYGVYFGEAHATNTTRVDEHTLVATTPAHLPGRVDVRIFEYDIFLATGLTFEFIGDPPVSAFERILLPVFSPPIPGAFGSEFRTALRVMNTGNREMEVFGLTQNCVVLCPDPNGDPMRLMPFVPAGDEEIIYLGKPGRFIYVTPEQALHFSANLRVYDTSRAGENFGTAIPIVRHSQFRTTPFGLVGVPTDPRFRNTLRLYATAPTTVRIDGLDDGDSRTVALSGGSLHEPAYAQISFSGTEAGLKNLVIVPAEGGPAVWGFVSVTNNLTQHITTVSPR
jgi:IPT/TIG domain